MSLAAAGCTVAPAGGRMAGHRRDVLRGLGGLAGMAAVRTMEARAPGGAAGFPRKDDFLIEDGYTYLNAAHTHAIPQVSIDARRSARGRRVPRDARRRAADRRAALHPPALPEGASGTPKALFAELINARPSEIAYVSSTSAGEHLVVQALGLHRTVEGNVVTDGLHFEGAILHLLELKKQGLDVRVVKPTKDFRIDLTDLERAVDRRTRLIEVSSASMYNGFQHDLKAVCELAHAHGAYVYADIIHSAGAEPFDVKASGVDFAACSTFKWLMGDFGIGFLYAKEALLDRIRRPVYGYYQAPDMEAFYPPDLPAGAYTPIAYTLQETAARPVANG